MSSIARDLRYGVRLLRRSPGVAVIAVLCLALGMGATTAVFTVVDAVVFRPLAYQHPERLVRLYTEFPTFPNGGLRRFPVSPPEFVEMRERLRSYEHLDAWQVIGVNLITTQEPMRVTATLVSGTLFDSLGVRPQMGRWLNPDDDREGAPQAILISDGLWRRGFGGNAAVLGRDTKLNGLPATIVGVMPPGFEYPPGQVDVSDVWAPLQLTAADRQRRGNHRLAVLAKLRPGVTLAQARQELAPQMTVWGARRSNNFHTIDPQTHPLLAYGMQEEVVRTVSPAMLVILGAVGFVLLIACVNVANLLLARAEARQKEIAVRTAMGAGTAGLIRQFLAEGLLIAASGALCGLGIAWAGVRLLLWAGSDAIPRASEVAIDWRVLAFTGAVLIATTVGFGLAPLAQILTRGTHDVLKAVAARSSATAQAAALRRALVVGELSLGLVLLVSCGLMVQAFWRLQAVDPGFDPGHLLTMRIALPPGQYADDAAVKSFLNRLEDGLARLPGVTSATVMAGLPPQRPADVSDVAIENFVPRPGGPVQNVDFWQFTGHRFFETLHARLVDGRLLDERDGENAPPVMVVNETMARTFWPGQSAIGHRLRLGPPASPWRTIVGVVADLKNAGTDQPTGTEFFVPWRQAQGIRNVQVVIRTPGPPLGVAGTARGAVAALDASLPIAAVRSMEEVLAQSQSRPRFLSILLTFFTVVAVTLSGIGVYGVISYAVARRSTEIGIRMALGADGARILRMVLKQGLALGAAGVVIGVSAALWLTRFLKTLLFGIQPLDAPTFAVTVALLFALTLIATWRSARRATQIDPAVALRDE
ncbi:MAG TPA: ABC transporter permease [Bryobacteraceae bacterium]|nr:ABC transporter permease [Bryobacteraceae bacterium]